MRARWVVPVAVGSLVLTGCSGEPRAQLRGDVEAITLAANDRDADAVREEVEDLLSTIRSQIASGELDRAEGERLRTIALRIAEGAALLEPEQAPSPSPSPEETEEEPTPSPSPEPSEEDSPSPEPSPSPTPEETEEEPEESPEPVIEISPVTSEEESASPAAARSTPEPEPSPEGSPDSDS